MLKKTLPTASTLTRLFWLNVPGTVIVSEPSFGVDAASVIGNVAPPLVESVIFTFAQLTGATFVFATFHVTVCVEDVFHVVLFDGCVTVNGPEAESTLSRMPSELIAPPSPRVSRSVTLKSIVRVVVGRDSPKVATPERMSDSRGNVRLGLVVGTNVRKSGRHRPSGAGSVYRDRILPRNTPG